MINSDPIKHVEKMVHEAHETAGKLTRPVLKRYPLLFSFLIVFSVAATLHGFDRWSEQLGFFDEHPFYLMLIGIFALFFTGTLYKSLEKMK